MQKQELIDLILGELKTICEENDIDGSNVNADTVLFGGDALIDSLGLVGLIIKVEEYVMDQTGKEIQMIDEEAIITEGNTPFRNAGTLADLAIQKANEA